MDKKVLKLLRENAELWKAEVAIDRKVKALKEEQKTLTTDDDRYYEINSELHNAKTELETISKKSGKLYIKICPLAKDIDLNDWNVMIEKLEEDFPDIGLGDILVRSNFA